MCFFTIDRSWLKKVKTGHLHYLSCSENSTLLRTNDTKISSKNLNKWEMNTISQGSEIPIQSYWALTTTGQAILISLILLLDSTEGVEDSATGWIFCNFLLISTTQLSLLFIGTLYEIWTAKQKVSLTSTDTITATVRESKCGASTYHLFGDRFIKKNPETHFL